MYQLTRRLRTTGARLTAAVVVLAIQLAIALPFLFLDPGEVRGVPGPLLVLTGVAASYVLGPRLGVALTGVAVVLAITIIGENAVAEPLLWLPVSLVTGLVGDRVRRDEETRHELLVELRRGLVAVYRDPEVGPLNVNSRYIPAESAQVLAGDFYGAIEQPGGRVAVMVGDVAGHGPAAAALATRLRAMWRGLALAGVSDLDTVRALNETLLAEQERISSPIPFATLCLVSMAADTASAQVLVAGHPPPILVTGSGAHECDLPPSPAIGISRASTWDEHTVELPGDDWSLVLYTDGLIEGRSAPNGPRPYGCERLLPVLAAQSTPLGQDGVDAVLAAVRAANGGPWPDDVVLIAASPRASMAEDGSSAGTPAV